MGYCRRRESYYLGLTYLLQRVYGSGGWWRSRLNPSSP